MAELSDGLKEIVGKIVDALKGIKGVTVEGNFIVVPDETTSESVDEALVPNGLIENIQDWYYDEEAYEDEDGKTSPGFVAVVMGSEESSDSVSDSIENSENELKECLSGIEGIYIAEGIVIAVDEDTKNKADEALGDLHELVSEWYYDEEDEDWYCEILDFEEEEEEEIDGDSVTCEICSTKVAFDDISCSKCGVRFINDEGQGEADGVAELAVTIWNKFKENGSFKEAVPGTPSSLTEKIKDLAAAETPEAPSIEVGYNHTDNDFFIYKAG